MKLLLPSFQSAISDFRLGLNPIGDYIEATVMTPAVIVKYVTPPVGPSIAVYSMTLNIHHSAIHGEPQLVEFVFCGMQRVNQLRPLQQGEEIRMRVTRMQRTDNGPGVFHHLQVNRPLEPMRLA